MQGTPNFPPPEQDRNPKQTHPHPPDPFANGAKDKLLELLSHELRTPLTPVLAAAELLGSPFKLSDAEVKKQADLIRRNILHEVRLIDDLLDLTRISKGRLQLKLQDVDIHRLIRDAAAVCQDEARRRHVSLDLELEASNHVVAGDSARLSQVFANLLSNAAKFSNDGGHVTIRTVNPQAHTLSIFVADQGLGIARDRIDTIFEPFSKSDTGLVPRTDGLGIGLHIAHGLIELHRGTLTATSDGLGKGATFTIDLPVLEPTLTTPDAPTPAPAIRTEPPSHYTILLVDDHDDTRNALRSLLERRGYQVFTASGLKDAVAIAATQRFDLLISDIGMPDGSGLELMQSLRPHGIDGIAISGHGTDEDLKRSREAGFTDHLTKPISIDALEATISELQAQSLSNSAAQAPPA